MTGLILPAHIAKERELKKHIEQWARNVLWKAYPSHLFMVEFNTDQKWIRVDHSLMAENQACMFIHPGEPDMEKALIRVAGEMLERANLPRKALEDYQQYEDAKATAKEAFACR